MHAFPRYFVYLGLSFFDVFLLGVIPRLGIVRV